MKKLRANEKLETKKNQKQLIANENLETIRNNQKQLEAIRSK